MYSRWAPDQYFEAQVLAMPIWMQVVNYVLEKLVIDKPLEDSASETTSTTGRQGSQQAFGNGYGPFRPGSRVWQQPVKPVVEIVCNDQVLQQYCSLPPS
jgi:WD repeat-containing protein 48